MKNIIFILFIFMLAAVSFFYMNRTHAPESHIQVETNEKNETGSSHSLLSTTDVSNRPLDTNSEQVNPIQVNIEHKNVVLIIEQEQALKVLINEYDLVLDDPEKKKDLEAQFKIQSEEFKKAILAKVKLGEL